MYFVDRTAVVLKPTARFLEWLKSADENMPDLTIEQIRANCSVFLVPQFDEPEEVIAYFDERYQQIFEAELAGWDIDKSKWPTRHEPEGVLGIFRYRNPRYGFGHGRSGIEHYARVRQYDVG